MEMEATSDYHEKPTDENQVAEDSASSEATTTVPDTETSSSESDDEDNDWDRLLSLSKLGKDLSVANKYEEIDDSPTDDLLKGNSPVNDRCLSNESTTSDVSEKYVSSPFEGESDDCTLVTAEEGSVDHNVDELKKILLCPQVCPPTKKVTTSQSQTGSPAKPSTEDEQHEENDPLLKAFCKGVPVDPEMTWDFSLQALNPDYKSKALWIEGNFYQKLVGKCLHEMHNVPCECEEKKKVSVCRLCHAVFCSNKCFKRAIKAQTGEEGGEEGSEEPEPLPKEVPNKSTKPVTNCQYSSKGPPVHKTYSKDSYPVGKLGIAENSRLTNFDKNLKGRDNHSKPKHFQNTTDVHSKARQQLSPKDFVPPQNLWPSQLRNTQPNTNKYSSPMKSPQRQPEPNNHGDPYSPTRNSSTSNPMNSQSQRQGFSVSKTNELPVDVSPRSFTEDVMQPLDQSKLSPSKQKPAIDKVLRNPGPPFLTENEEPKNFFNPRGLHPHNNSFPRNFQQARSQEEQLHNYPDQRNRLQRRNSSGSHTSQNRQNNTYPNADQFRPHEHEPPTSPPIASYSPDSNRNLEDFSRPPLNNLSNNSWRGRYPEDFQNQYGRGFHHLHQGQPGRGSYYFPNSTRGNFGPNRFPGNQSSSSSYEYKMNENGKFISKGDKRGRGDLSGRPNCRSPPLQLPPRPFQPKNPETARKNIPDEILSNSSSMTMYTSKDFTPSNSTNYYSTKSTNSIDGDSYKPTWKFAGPLDLPFGVLMQVQYVRGKDFHDFSVMTSRNADAFKRLHHDLQTCEKFKMKIVRCESLCMAKWGSIDSENSPEEWYRGKIVKDLCPNFGVYFLDLGIEVVVNSEAIFELPNSLAIERERPLAFRVRSLNVKADSSDDEVTEQFNTLVRGRRLKIRITHKDTTAEFRFGCQLDVEHVSKWFDAGMLLKKLQVGDQATQEDILREEQRNQIIPCAKNALPDTFMRVMAQGAQLLPSKITQVVGSNDFYVITLNYSATPMQEMDKALLAVDSEPIKFLKDLSHPLFMWVERVGENYLRSRVKILEVCDNGIEVLVQKVDNGEILLVRREELIKLPMQLFTPSACAFKCSLPIRPKARSKGTPFLYENVRETLENIVMSPQLRGPELTYIRVLSRDQSTNTHIVEVFMKDTPTGLASSSVAKGWAEFLPGYDEAQLRHNGHF